jgi:hypothetical protein
MKDEVIISERQDHFHTSAGPGEKGFFHKLPVIGASASSPALREAEKAFDRNSSSASAHLPELKINLDEKIEYLANHSAAIDTLRRASYDLERTPELARAYWGGAAVALGAGMAAFAFTKNPAALGLRLPTVSLLSPAVNYYATESFNFAGLTGIAAGAGLQQYCVNEQLRDKMPSSKFPVFKSIDLTDCGRDAR